MQREKTKWQRSL